MNGQKFFQWIGYFIVAILALSLIVTLGQMWSQWIVFLGYIIGATYVIVYAWTQVKAQKPWVRYGVMAAIIILLVVALNSYLGITIKITPPNPPPISWPQKPAPTSTINIPPSTTPTPRPSPTSINKPRHKKIDNSFHLVPTLVTKISETESTVRMNGSEKNGVNVGLILKPDEEFKVEYKRGRITYNKKGDSCPIWGGNGFSDLPVRYRIDKTGNGVVAVVRDIATGEEKIFSFAEGDTTITGYNHFQKDAKIFLYYNCVLSFRDPEDGLMKNGHDFCGLRGSTATLKVTVIPSRETPTISPSPDEQGSEDEIAPSVIPDLNWDPEENLDSRLPTRSCYSVAGGRGNDK